MFGRVLLVFVSHRQVRKYSVCYKGQRIVCPEFGYCGGFLEIYIEFYMDGRRMIINSGNGRLYWKLSRIIHLLRGQSSSEHW